MAYPIGKHYVKFIRGTPKAWKTLKKKDPDTLYFISEEKAEGGRLFLGDKLISSGDGKADLKLEELEDVLTSEDIKNNSCLVYNKEMGLWEDKVINASKVFYNTTEYWTEQEELIAEFGAFYIYSDYKFIEDKYVPGIKVGNGVDLLKDLPFLDNTFWEHIQDTGIHITRREREFWNNKVSVDLIEEDELIIFKTTED